ncbi:MAG: hypothetical protein KAG61_10770 [Bacteriovoracaceae bacterium]|nr:hypothetical protein [Bacteriovoracaceae bacterium]
MKSLILSLTLLLSLNALSALHFQSNQNHLDPNCPSWNEDRFSRVESWFTVGVINSIKVGYNYEVPITRKQVDAIWCAAVPAHVVNSKLCKGIVDLTTDRPFAKYAGKRPNQAALFPQFDDLEQQLTAYLDYSVKSLKREQISHPNIGIVLEMLSRYYLQELTSEYPKELYVITGGIEYKKNPKTNVIGELDIVVYDRYSCQVVAIGESKASSVKSNSRSLRKAKAQLRRFQDNLN